MGVRLSLDDFGMGESSLSRLQQLHFDEVKIDRSFVSHVCNEPTDRNIVAFTTRLAHSLGMKVVAEGVETAQVLSALAELGPDLAQGFHLHRPSSPSQFPTLGASDKLGCSGRASGLGGLGGLQAREHEHQRVSEQRVGHGVRVGELRQDEAVAEREQDHGEVVVRDRRA